MHRSKRNMWHCNVQEMCSDPGQQRVGYALLHLSLSLSVCLSVSLETKDAVSFLARVSFPLCCLEASASAVAYWWLSLHVIRQQVMVGASRLGMECCSFAPSVSVRVLWPDEKCGHWFLVTGGLYRCNWVGDPQLVAGHAVVLAGELSERLRFFLLVV